MDVIKFSIDWVKAELFSAKIIWLFSVIVLLSAAGFAYWWKTTTARAFIIPLVVSGVMLASAGVGLYVANKPRLTKFPKEYQLNANEFIKREIERTSKSREDFVLVFKILPSIIIVSAVILMIFPSANWRATTITIILTAAFLMAIDSNTAARNAAYRLQLLNHAKP
jgi:ABC-2 type transport system permease protein